MNKYFMLKPTMAKPKMAKTHNEWNKYGSTNLSKINMTKPTNECIFYG
jgi:hypothetical protein